jgi:hypothetical protein
MERRHTPISPAQREDIYCALSEAFVDSQVDYALIARQTQAYDRHEIKRMLYEEVAPVCYPNLAAVIPPIWTGFARAPLLEDIQQWLEGLRRSRLRRAWALVYVSWIRWRCAYIWAEITQHYPD